MEKFICKYESLDDFLNALITKPINKEVFGNNPSSESKNYNFTGTHSFKEAWNLCRYTQDEGFENFKEKFNYINFKTSNYYNREKAYKCIGYAPNVGRFLNGYPNDMNNFELVSRKRRINVTMNCSYSSFEQKSAIENRGICVLNLIEYLENKGYEVNFQFEEVSYSGDEIIQIIIVLKKPRERLNIKYCYFPLVNPSFLRRLIFRATEIIPDIGGHWRYGYGIPYIYTQEEMKKQENTIYIMTPDKMGIKGENIETDFENFINFIEDNYNNLLNNEEENKKRKVR